MTGFEKAKRWYEKETAIATGRLHEPNEFAPYVPLEVRSFFVLSTRSGKLPLFTDTHFHLWASIAQITGVETFAEPLGWNSGDIQTHLLGHNTYV